MMSCQSLIKLCGFSPSFKMICVFVQEFIFVSCHILLISYYFLWTSTLKLRQRKVNPSINKCQKVRLMTEESPKSMDILKEQEGTSSTSSEVKTLLVPGSLCDRTAGDVIYKVIVISHTDKVPGGVVEVNVNRTHISVIPNEVLEQVFNYLGPIDLNSCREVCRDWRVEVNKQTKNFIKYEINSEDELNEGLDLLKAQKPNFVISELKLCYEPLTRPYNSSLLSQFIKNVPRMRLGKLIFGGDWREWKGPALSDLNPRVLEEIMQSFPNMFCFKELRINIDPNVYNCLFQVKDPTTGRMRETYFPNMRDLILPNYKGSLTLILKHFPNLKRLSLRKLTGPFLEYMDASRLEIMNLRVLTMLGCQQLEALALRLTKLSGDITEDLENGIERKNPNTERVRRIIEALRGFLITQASTLKELSLDIRLRWVDTPKFDLFPCLLPNLVKLETQVECSPTPSISNILESVPQLESLSLDQIRYYPWIPNSFFDDGRTHQGVKELVIRSFIVESTNLPSISRLFPKLRSLCLGEVGHGLLPFLYQELPNLTSLEVSAIYLPDTETLEVTDFDSKSKPKGPGIRDMKKLKNLKIGFLEPEGMIRDSFLVYGLLYITKQLTTLTFERAKFSKTAVHLLESQMELKSATPELTISEDGYYTGDFKFVRKCEDLSGDEVDEGP